MSDLTIRTNNHWHDLSSFYDLPESARSDFYYVDVEDHQNPRFVCYRGFWYDTHEFIRIHAMSNSDPHAMRPEADSPFDAWTGYQSDSFFSGVVLRYDNEFERIQIGRYFT